LQVAPLCLAAVMMATAVCALVLVYDIDQIAIDDSTHGLMGFVLGFLLVTMGNFSHSNYDKAVTGMNRMVQDAIHVCCEVLPCVGRDRAKDDIAMCAERKDFQRLITLYFRLCCYEVRADIQARKNRFTWLDPDGGVCTEEERAKFACATERTDHWQEWDYEHYETGSMMFWAQILPIGCSTQRGSFTISVRPAMVASWLCQKLDHYYEQKWIPSPPVHARMLAQLQDYTRWVAQMIQIDRTPLPFSYVQMAATMVILFTLTLPCALVKEFGWSTILVSAFFAYAYGGLYINACNLRNPFNFEGTTTGLPINAFVQRLERVTEAVLCDCNGDYNDIVPNTPASNLGGLTVDTAVASGAVNPNSPKRPWYDVLQKMNKLKATSRAVGQLASLRQRKAHRPMELDPALSLSLEPEVGPLDSPSAMQSARANNAGIEVVPPVLPNQVPNPVELDSPQQASDPDSPHLASPPPLPRWDSPQQASDPDSPHLASPPPLPRWNQHRPEPPIN